MTAHRAAPWISLALSLLVLGSSVAVAQSNAAPRSPNAGMVMAHAPLGSSATADHLGFATPLWSAISTQDPDAYESTGLASEVIPYQGTLPLGATWYVLAEEPINATEAVAAGLAGTEGAGGAQWSPVEVMWGFAGNPGPVVRENSSMTFAGGSSIEFQIGITQGGWWGVGINNMSVSFPGGSSLVESSRTSSEGLLPPPAPVGAPTLWQGGTAGFVQAPFMQFSSALFVNDSNSSEIPFNGVWTSSGPGWGVAGEDQVSGQAGPFEGDVDTGAAVGPNLPNGSWIWGIGGSDWTAAGNVTFPGLEDQTNVGIAALVNFAQGLPPRGASYRVEIWEPFNDTLASVGLWVGSPWGVIPYYDTVQNGTVVDSPSNPTLTGVFGTSLRLQLNTTGGGWWNCSYNGDTIMGGETGNSTFDLGPTTSSNGTSPWMELFIQNSTPADAPPLVLEPAFTVNATGSGYALPTSAETSAGPSWVKGYVQDALLPPGEIDVDPSYTTVPGGTLLWGATNYPTPSVGFSGLPSVVSSFENVTADLWINGSAGPLSGSEISFNLPRGVALAGPPALLADGAYDVPLSFGRTIIAEEDLNGTVQVGAPGYNATTYPMDFQLVEGNISVQDALTERPVGAGTDEVIWVWSNGSAGAGPQALSNLTLRSSLGGVVSPLGWNATQGAFGFNYTAPEVTGATQERLLAYDYTPGFVPTATYLVFGVLPAPLAVAARAWAAPWASEAPETLAIWVNASATGTPLPGASFLVSADGASLAAPISVTPLVPGEYLLGIVAPGVEENLTAPVAVLVTVPGYNATLAMLDVAVVVLPLQATASLGTESAGAVPVDVKVSSSGQPLAGASVLLEVAAGLPTLQVRTTSATGEVTLYWDPPSGGTSTTYSLLLRISDPGYQGRNLTLSFRTPPPSSSTNPYGPTGSPSAWVWLLPVLVVLVFLAMLVWGRRTMPPREPPKVPEGVPPEATAPGKPAGSEKVLKGADPATATAPEDEA